ncbi:putative atlastin-2 [Apostichopus japonicus]|uniref:Putative atlastin-2 n=1 Tax=Stichopus japonicus TaxID=307972 RepID=A0A2G8LL20_STIJA|nr:putative atlastin-2 [Apostichopus japonicus]
MNGICLLFQGATDWLGKDDEPLTGFSWRGGSERETTGIWAWNKLFICEIVEGEEIAVMLLDTQGAFDTESTVKDCATVFALSTMVSSVQTFNLSQNIQEDDLHHLQLFTEYGRLALEKEEVKEKPFQCLLFLVRDWSYPYEYAYGEAGGQLILDRKLDDTRSRHEELQEVRKHIRSCFEKISCFLMPHPGLAVARQKEYDGRLADIDSEFQDYLKVLAPMLLAPSNLIVKSINGSHVRCKDLLEYFKAYVNIYQNSELPEPKTMLRATSEANNLAAVALALDQYNTEMDKVCGGDKPYIGPEELENNHHMILAASLKTFDVTPKMGGLEFSDTYKENLIKDIEDRHAHYEKNNESKNLFNVARTPITLVVTMVIMYLLSGIFGLLGVYSLSNLANLVLGTSVMALMVWCYVRYTGQYLSIGAFVDSTADVVWLQVYGPAYKFFTNSSGTSRAPRKKND